MKYFSLKDIQVFKYYKDLITFHNEGDEQISKY